MKRITKTEDGSIVVRGHVVLDRQALQYILDYDPGCNQFAIWVDDSDDGGHIISVGPHDAASKARIAEALAEHRHD